MWWPLHHDGRGRKKNKCIGFSIYICSSFGFSRRDAGVTTSDSLAPFVLLSASPVMMQGSPTSDSPSTFVLLSASPVMMQWSPHRILHLHLFFFRLLPSWCRGHHIGFSSYICSSFGFSRHDAVVTTSDSPSPFVLLSASPVMMQGSPHRILQLHLFFFRLLPSWCRGHHRWRIRCGDPLHHDGEAERRTNGDGESDVVTPASWREKRKEEQMEMENPMWWPLHHDGTGRKKNTWSWRIRCGDPCIMTGEAERRTNGDGESDVVTTASWQERPKEENMELENTMWWPLHHNGRGRKKKQIEMENPMWWPLHHDGRGRKKNKWSWRIRCGDHCIMTGEAERRTK